MVYTVYDTHTACASACCCVLQAANAVGYGGKSHQAILDATRTPKGSVDYFVELHIEQGPLLEKVRAVPVIDKAMRVC
jgi:hypothetical protein